MRFNENKFMRDTNYSHTYANWSKELIDVLEETGILYPSYENGSHVFLRSVKKDGKYKRTKLIYITCPCDRSEISVSTKEKMDKEEYEIAMNYVAKFISVMTKHGYIE